MIYIVHTHNEIQLTLRVLCEMCEMAENREDQKHFLHTLCCNIVHNYICICLCLLMLYPLIRMFSYDYMRKKPFY